MFEKLILMFEEFLAIMPYAIVAGVVLYLAYRMVRVWQAEMWGEQNVFSEKK